MLAFYSATAVAQTNEATGAPGIAGPAQVGRTLTASPGDIADADGLTDPVFSYQWYRVDGGTETALTGATAATYTVQLADRLKTMRVRASFTDDNGNAEVRNADTNLVMPDAVSNCDDQTLWCATLTAGVGRDNEDEVDAAGFNTTVTVPAVFGSVAPTTFAHRGVRYTVTDLFAGGQNDVVFATSPHLPADGAGLTLHVQTIGGDLDLALSGATFDSRGYWFFPAAVTVFSDGQLENVPLLRPSFQTSARITTPTDGGTRVAVRLSAEPQANFAVAFHNAVEGGEDANVTVLLDVPPASPVAVPLIVSGQGGATVADWSGIPSSLTFESSETSKSFKVSAVDDSIEEEGESVEIGFGDLPPGVSAGRAATTTVTLLDRTGLGPASTDIRLQDPKAPDEGRLEVRYQGKWGTVCDDRFKDPGNFAPAFACRLMGYADGEFAHGYGRADVLLDAQPVWLDDLRCKEDSTHWTGRPPTELSHCWHAGIGVHNCTHAEDAGVRCFRTAMGTAPRLIGASLSRARLTLRFDANLDAGSTPSARDFVVLAGAAQVPVESAAVAGAEVVLYLGRTVPPGDSVTMSYLGAPMHPLRALDGTATAALTDVAVQRFPDVDHAAAPAPVAPRPALAAALAALTAAAPDGPRRVDLSGRGLPTIPTLPGTHALRELNLENNALVDLSPLTDLYALEVLDLSGNRLTAIEPLRSLTGLRRLDLSGNRIVDPSPLAGMHELEVLLLDGNRIRDLGPLAHLPRLRNLGLAHNRIVGVEPLADMPALLRLDLSGNPLSDLTPLGDIGNLVWLDAAGTALVDAATAATLGRLTRLRWLWADPSVAEDFPATAPRIVRQTNRYRIREY